MNANARHLEHLATEIDHHGVAAVESALVAVIDRARGVGADPVLLSVLADPTQPEIARARAFGLLSAQLAHADRRAPSDAGVLAGVGR